jgi:hypothetical protein
MFEALRRPRLELTGKEFFLGTVPPVAVAVLAVLTVFVERWWWPDREPNAGFFLFLFGEFAVLTITTGKLLRRTIEESWWYLLLVPSFWFYILVVTAATYLVIVFGIMHVC